MSYQLIQEYAKDKGIDLNAGYRVWMIFPSGVQPCGLGNVDVFSLSNDAYNLALQHPAGERVVVTGPDGKWVELKADDRIPLPRNLG